MIEKVIPDEDGNGHYRIFSATDVEFVDPIKYYREVLIRLNFSMERDLLIYSKPPFPIQLIEQFLLRRAIKEWEKKLEEIKSTTIPSSLISLLKSTSKKEQISLLNGLQINPEELLAFIIKAHTDFGFTFSQYTAEYHHSGLDESALPKVIEIKDGNINKIGETTLTDGQLKNVVEHRKVTISKFIDNGSSWHCFFTTFKSLKGEEKAWKDGQPHYHYISDKFGMTRERVVSELKSRNYNLNTLPHIDLLGYGEQPKKP